LVDRAPVANSNYFDVIYNSNIPPINVIANDSLTPQWTISLTTPASVGQAIDLADGRFQIVAPDVLATQTFIYQVCNPNCPVSYCDTALVTVEIRGGLDCEVPNVFTPNGDGVNDALVIPCLQNFPNSTITIFNRWGDEVFSTNNYQNNWEGTYNGGFLPDGTYFYILQVNSNPVQNVQGFVELRR
jgi:gliding motility-associated-like protein